MLLDVFDNRVLHIRGGHGEFDAQLWHTVWYLGNEIEADRITDGGKGNISLAKHIMKACDGDEILPRLCAHTKDKNVRFKVLDMCFQIVKDHG